MSNHQKTQQIEFGDFQTPPELADQICHLLRTQGVKPATILEPTCGKGDLLLAALNSFFSVQKAIGLDINSEYIQTLQGVLSMRADLSNISAVRSDFFTTDWANLLNQLSGPILIIGNPPWVTNSELTTLNGQNLPQKSNFQQFSGLDALTGKSNFDISEWMLIHLLEQLKGRQATLAMLCKTSVARRVLAHAWKNHFPLSEANLYWIDAKKFFNVAVDACLLVCSTPSAKMANLCHIYTGFDKSSYQTTFGLADNRLVADLKRYEQWRYLRGENPYKWRSGIKHDCAKVMEFKQETVAYRNGLDELCVLEDNYLYPMLKSSDIANSARPIPSRWMLVPQMAVGEDTRSIHLTAPLTWAYLNQHSHFLDTRKSAIYKNQPRFAIFGIGDYSFAPWKVAISSLYKKLHFAVIEPYAGKPVVLDDTCYSLPCTTKDEAECLATLLNSEVASQFFTSLIFWDTKRPITVDILSQLDIFAVAQALDALEPLKRLTSAPIPETAEIQQLSLFA